MNFVVQTLLLSCHSSSSNLGE